MTDPTLPNAQGSLDTTALDQAMTQLEARSKSLARRFFGAEVGERRWQEPRRCAQKPSATASPISRSPPA